MMGAMSGATISREHFNLVNRVRHLERGKRYMVILDVPEEGMGEMSWTVTDLGKVEKPTRGRANEIVEVKVTSR